MKSRKTILIAVLGLGLLLGGCGRQTGADLGESPAMTQQESVTGTGGDTAGEAAPGGEAVPDGEYVYDYQVSMEPIPKEIAELGGPCQGTIHAFPSQIKMGLTEKRMEEDPELKAEVEKRIPEVEAYLEENIGGEFRVNGVAIFTNLSWIFICTEIDTGYQFELKYVNYEYAAEVRGETPYVESEVYLNDYYTKEYTQTYAPEYNEIVEEIFSDSYYKVWVRKAESTIPFVDINIIQYTEKIDKCEEQLKILELWKELQEANDSASYTIVMAYCPQEYAEAMEEKYEKGFIYDSMQSIREDGINALLEEGELTAYFRYYGDFDERNEINLETLLSDYQKGRYEENKVWQYWYGK